MFKGYLFSEKWVYTHCNKRIRIFYEKSVVRVDESCYFGWNDGILKLKSNYLKTNLETFKICIYFVNKKRMKKLQSHRISREKLNSKLPKNQYCTCACKKGCWENSYDSTVLFLSYQHWHNGWKIEEESEIMTFVSCFFPSRYLQKYKALRQTSSGKKKKRKKLFTISKTELFELVNIAQRLVKRHEVINNFELKKQQ